MSFKYQILPPKRIIKIMTQKFDFKKISEKGSHVKYKNFYTQRIFIIPMHKEIAVGTFKSILERANIELEEFLKYL